MFSPNWFVSDLRFCIAILVSTCCSSSSLLLAEVKAQPLTSTVAEVHTAVDSAEGLCVYVGSKRGFEEMCLKRLKQGASRKLWHCFTKDLESAQALQREYRSERPSSTLAHLVAEPLKSNLLPHLSNLANLVVVESQELLADGEAERVACPGGILITLGSAPSISQKAPHAANDEWTHQWHGADGGLTTEQELGVPTGVQWLAGPLFAMAGRKSSTQTLVSSAGRNFYVTQNVLENVGRPVEEMAQFLVARDAYNGLQLWQRPWTGPFVSGNGETNPRMIATPEMLYAVQTPNTVAAIIPATGDDVKQFDSPEEIEKIIFNNGLLFVQTLGSIVAVDGETLETTWRFESKNLSGLSLAEGKVWALSSGRSEDGSFQHDLISLEEETGAVRFQKNTQPHVTAARVRINFAQDGYVALQAHGFLHMFDAKAGEHLWTKTTEARPGKTYVDERYVGHFYRRGLVWMLNQNSPRESEGQNVWLALDPATGDVVRTLETRGDWPRTATPAKMGCQVLIASDRYVLIPRQSTYIDLDSGEKHSFKFTRGGCGLGFVPANGLLYSHPHACGCFSEAIRGFMGMHSSQAGEFAPYDNGRLSKFISARSVKPTLETPAWSMHRASVERGAFLDENLPGKLSLAWSLPVSRSESLAADAWRLRSGSPVSAATSDSTRVYCAEVNAGRVVAADKGTGQILWEFFAAGRVDSPPTLFKDTCIFGSHDGNVYCLDSEAGSLLWQYQVAPRDQRIVAFGSVDSSWPVAGSVLIQNGIAYAAAGRGPDADGGIQVVALNAMTGEPVWNTSIRDEDFWGLSDYLVGGKGSVFLSNRQFAAGTGEQTKLDDNAESLRGGKVGLLEASWTRHDLALRKQIQTWTARGAAGQLLAFGPNLMASWNAETRTVILDSDEHFEMELAPGEQVTSMALSKNRLIIAGGYQRLEPMHGGFMRAISLKSGEVLQEIKLSSEPVFDGLSLSNGSVYIALQDGTLHSFSSGK